MVAYDLPIGPCASHRKREFWSKLNHLADWRHSDPYFFADRLDIPAMQPLINTETADTLRRQQEQTTAMWKQPLAKESQFA